MSSSPFLSVVVPAYNETERLRRNQVRFQKFFSERDFSWELILVDDGSQDETHRCLDGFFPEDRFRVLRNPVNRGKGYSVRRGVMQASGKRVLVTDADLSTPLEECDKLFRALDEGEDIAIGSRALRDSEVTRHQAWYREGMGKFFNLLVQGLVLPGLWDTQCGFKCFKRETAGPLFEIMTLDGFCFDVEFLFLARRRGLNIREIPVHWENDVNSRVDLVQDSLRMFRDLFRIRWNLLRGLYD